MFDTSFIYGLQGAVFQMQKTVIGVIVLVFLFSMLRFVIWAVLSQWMDSWTAGTVASAVTVCAAFVIFSRPDALSAAAAFGYDLAASLGITGALPGAGVFDTVFLP